MPLPTLSQCSVMSRTRLSDSLSKAQVAPPFSTRAGMTWQFETKSLPADAVYSASIMMQRTSALITELGFIGEPSSVSLGLGTFEMLPILKR